MKTPLEKDRHAQKLIRKAGSMQDEAIESLDFAKFFRYHALALRLIEYRIGLKVY